VAFGKQANHNLFNDFILADDDLMDFVANLLGNLANVIAHVLA
jgi:hypothetical protein